MFVRLLTASMTYNNLRCLDAAYVFNCLNATALIAELSLVFRCRLHLTHPSQALTMYY